MRKNSLQNLPQEWASYDFCKSQNKTKSEYKAASFTTQLLQTINFQSKTLSALHSLKSKNMERRGVMKYLDMACNPGDQLRHSAVDTGFIAPAAALSPAHHPGQPPVAAGSLTHQGPAAVPLHMAQKISFRRLSVD